MYSNARKCQFIRPAGWCLERLSTRVFSWLFLLHWPDLKAHAERTIRLPNASFDPKLNRLPTGEHMEPQVTELSLNLRIT